jgi:integral membrane protein
MKSMQWPYLRGMKLHPTVKRLRLLGYLEAISWLALLFIAMPLKYLWDMPTMVRYVGWAHGILFILYCLHLLLAKQVLKWSFGKMITGGIAAFFPFGTLWFDKRIEAGR